MSVPRRSRAAPPRRGIPAAFALLAALLACSRLRAQETAPAAVRWELVGNENVSGGDLRIVLGALEEDLLSGDPGPGLLDDMSFEVARYYEAIGFLKATVQCRARTEDKKTVVRVEIHEGPRSELVSLVFEGQSRFTAEELGKCFEWGGAGILGTGPRVYTRSALDGGLVCVVTRYQLEGHLFAAATPSISIDGESKVSVRVAVDEGPVMRLALPVRLEGVTSFSEPAILNTLAIEEVPGADSTIYVPRLPLLIRGKIQDFYRNRGFLEAEVDEEREVDRSARRVRLVYRVKEGPLTRIDGIDIEGNERTWDWVVLGRLRLAPGDLYSDEAIRESHKSLLRSGLFSRVALEAKPVAGKEGHARLDVKVEERARFSAGVFAGWGSYELARGGIRLTDRNLFGTGHRLTADLWGSFKGEGARLEYVNPYVFTDSLSHNVIGRIEHREHPSFTELSRSAETGLRYRLTEETIFGVAYRLRESSTSGEEEEIPRELVNDVLLSSVLLSAIYDNRNSFVDPTSGFTLRATVEDSSRFLGSDLDFVRLTGLLSNIVPLGHGLRLVTAARAGLIFRTGDRDEEIPIQERFFNGGEYTIRSFKQDEAGPKAGDEPIGGEAFTTFNVELRVPIPTPVELLDGLQLALFFDSGTLVTDVKDFGGGRYFFGVGSGLRYNTPVGPLRLDAAFNPDRAEGEDRFVVHFGLGYPF